MTEILTEKENSILTVTLNRPEKRNALNDPLINSLKAELRRADADESLRAIVIRGAGKDFCSGADLSALQKITESDVLENLWDAENLMELFAMIRKIKIPVIAAVQGRALAGGCGLGDGLRHSFGNKIGAFRLSRSKNRLCSGNGYGNFAAQSFGEKIV